ncbi:MAG: RNA polymerase sigma factor [Aestuariibacter sp.]
MTDDHQLMSMVQKGQVNMLAPLFEKYHVALFNYFLRHGNSNAIAEDLVQETFIKVLAYRSSYQGRGSFRGWLYGIARNTMADQYRKSQNRHESHDTEHVENMHGASLEGTLQDQQSDQLFHKALTTMNGEYRDLLILSRFQQLNYEEIAAMTACNLNTLKSRMRKAVGLLKDTYQQLLGEQS